VLELSEMLAGSTGLEPAASGVTGRRSNQLNYNPVVYVAVKGEERPVSFFPFHFATVQTKWAVQGSNLRQPACKAGALPLS
jgi:hypothetical protein